MFAIKLIQKGKHWGWLTPSGKVFMLNTCPDSAKFPSAAEAAEGLATSQAGEVRVYAFREDFWRVAAGAKKGEITAEIVPVGTTAEQRLLRLMVDAWAHEGGVDPHGEPPCGDWGLQGFPEANMKLHIETAPYGDGVAGVEYLRAMSDSPRKPLPGFEDQPFPSRVWLRRIAIAHALQYLTEDEVEVIIKASATARYPGMLWEIAEAPTPNTVNIFKGSVIIRKCGGLLIGNPCPTDTPGKVRMIAHDKQQER